MAFYGVGIDEAVQRLNFQFRLALKKKGGLGLHSLAEVFRCFDTNGNKKLDFKEFEKGLASIGIFPSIVEIQALMLYYDTDKDGHISYEEFVAGLREPMNPRRQALVEKIYGLLDKNASGSITPADIEARYRVESNPDFRAGKKTKQEVLEGYLANFEGIKASKGAITKAEFMEYYTELSMVLPSDDYFISILENAWMVVEGTDTSTPQDKLRAALSAFINKLKAVAAPLDEEMVQKTFQEFNRTKSGGLSIDEFKLMFSRLEIPAEKKTVTDILRMFDKNKSGSIEYEEFQVLINTAMSA